MKAIDRLSNLFEAPNPDNLIGEIVLKKKGCSSTKIRIRGYNLWNSLLPFFGRWEKENQLLTDFRMLPPDTPLKDLDVLGAIKMSIDKNKGEKVIVETVENSPLFWGTMNICNRAVLVFIQSLKDTNLNIRVKNRCEDTVLEKYTTMKRLYPHCRLF